MPSSYPSAQPKPPASPLSPASFLARLIGGVVLVNLFLFTLVGLSIQHSYRQYQERAEITTQNLTQTLERDIAGAIKTDDLALFAAMDEYQRQRAAGAVDGKALNAYLGRVRSRLPEIDALWITNAQGMLVYGNNFNPGAPTSLADRPYFIRLRDDPQAGLVISKPLVGRVSHQWVITLARRIDQPDGSFAGMVFAAITLEYLSRTFSALNVGAHGVIVLRDEDLGVVVRYPELQGVDSTVGSTVMAREFKEMIRAQPSAGTTMTRSSLDNIERTYSYRKVGAYPFYILVGQATRDYLSAWRHKATEQAALAALFTLITSWAAWLIYRAWKRQANLELEREKYLRFFRLSADLMCIADPFGCFTEVNPAFIRLIGYSESELIAKPFLEFILPEDRQKTAEEMKLQVSIRPSLNFENRFLCKDGATVFLSWTAYFDKSDGITYATARDVTAFKQAELALLKSKQQYDNLAAKIPVGICVLHSTLEGKFTLDYVSPRVAEILNTSVGNLLADVQAEFQKIHPDDLNGFVKLIQDRIQQQRTFDWKGRVLIEGVVKWIHIESSPEPPENGVVLWHALVTDITATKRMEEEVRQLAFYDPLTKLPNRRLLNDRLSQSISAGKRSGLYSALIFLDLDNFKPLNDAHGHGAGDLLLIEVANRLKSCVREIDTVARIGGDEFVVLLSQLNVDKAESNSQAGIVAEKIRIALAQPYRLTLNHEEKEAATVEHRCSASIGVVVYINHEGSQDEILQWADTAMYEAKEAGRNSIRFYDLKA
jgi:diguanylate cyclase (GGDEF)-like protein/PAS domain S-box-containing protein